MTMDAKNIKILIADDEPDIIEFLQYNLQKEGFQVFTASDGQQALRIAREEQPQLIILDIMMPKMDGIEVCRNLRESPEFQQTLIVFLTARDEDFTQVAALDVGGDDYITKPIRPRVFISRLFAILRRLDKVGNEISSDSNIIVIGNLKINKEKISVLKGEEEIFLAKKEFELLCLLISRPGKVYTRAEIFYKIWGNDVIVGDRTIDVHIRKLREKIGEDYIGTVKGIGYKFEE
jgi:two-component system, OmpR family, alkaline phosphatase synthesis response regulator PhoP